jgi:hypothetical protein
MDKATFIRTAVKYIKNLQVLEECPTWCPDEGLGLDAQLTFWHWCSLQSVYHAARCPSRAAPLKVAPTTILLQGMPCKV